MTESKPAYIIEGYARNYLEGIGLDTSLQPLVQQPDQPVVPELRLVIQLPNRGHRSAWIQKMVEGALIDVRDGAGYPITWEWK